MPRKSPRLVLIDRPADAPVVELAVHATDAELRPIQSAKVDAEGNFDLPAAAIEKAAFVAIGRYEEKPVQLVRGQVALYRSAQFRDLLKQSDTIEIARGIWETILHYRRCVSGKVRRCSWWPWWYDRIALLASTALARRIAAAPAREAASAPAIRTADIAISPARLLPEGLSVIHPFHRCSTVCEGLVEVYRRTCCWWPIVVLDPRIPALIDILERYVEVRPIRFPPNPPDPPPFENVSFFKGGALDEAAFNAPRDLAALRALPAAQQPAYIEARPYLRHLFHCGDYHKVGQGLIQPDGTFQVCWWAIAPILLPHCHDEVAYVVKQIINGSPVTIYDGLAAGHWFHIGDNPTLTSYHPLAVGCRDGNDPRVEGAAIYLDAIGGTDAYHLKTPDAAGWDRVDPPVFNDGLCFPATAAAAKGHLLNRNWGGTLNLRYWFTEPTRATGAYYYRASVRRADATGAPDGSAPFFLGPPGGAWQKLVALSGGGFDLVSVPLGAAGSPGGESNLYRIPYDADLPPTEEWRDGQYHAVLDTTDHAEGRYLLTVEVFNATGQRLRPTGAAGTGIDAGFRYLHWVAPGDPDTFDNVPFAGLTHMLWWDNRAGTGDIIGLRRDNIPTSGVCQFLTDNAGTGLKVDFIAHHPVEMFHHAHSLSWYQGVNGDSGSIPVLHPFDNEGSPPATAASSDEVTFGSLLGAHTKCSFAVHLNMSLKTFNGSYSLFPSSVREVAAFALDIS